MKKWNYRPLEARLEKDLNRFKKYTAALEEEIKLLRKAVEFYSKDNFLEQEGKILECKNTGELTFKIQPAGTFARETLESVNE